MKSKILLTLLVTVATVAADEGPSYNYPAPQSEESAEGYYKYSAESIEANYNFGYNVENDFKHQESRDSGNTRGSYSVQLPDGRRQTVTYHVDGKNGFVADVTYEGEARHPKSSESYESPRTYESRESPRYAPPRPSYSAPVSEEDSYEEPKIEASRRPPRPSYSAPVSEEDSYEEPEFKAYRPPRPSYSAPVSEEDSYEEPEVEASRYRPPRPSYSAQVSEEDSFEEQQYRQPPRRYGRPDSK